MTTKRPASMFFWSDHLRDPKLSASSLAAQGLWVRILGMMHEGTPYGYLTVAGSKAPTMPQLARMIGESAAVLRKLLAELEANGVYSKTDEGVIYSRRMVRDERKRSLCAEAGKLGGNPRLKGKGEEEEGQPPEPPRPLRVTDKGESKPNPTPSVAVAKASVAVPERNTKSEVVSEAAVTELDALVERFMAERYGSATPERRAKIREQLAALRSPEGVKYDGNCVRASSDRHLNQAIRDTLRDSITKPDGSIVVLFKKLSRPELDERGRTRTEAMNPNREAADRRVDQDFERWKRDNPELTKEFEANALRHAPGSDDASLVMREGFLRAQIENYRQQDRKVA